MSTLISPCILQSGTESFLFTTNKVYDNMEKEQARLYYPFTLSITKSKFRYVYPFFYETVSLLFLEIKIQIYERYLPEKTFPSLIARGKRTKRIQQNYSSASICISHGQFGSTTIFPDGFCVFFRP